MEELYGAEFSLNQKCFHLDTLDRILKLNRGTVEGGGKNDYLVFFVGTADECSQEIKKMQTALEGGNYVD